MVLQKSPCTKAVQNDAARRYKEVSGNSNFEISVQGAAVLFLDVLVWERTNKGSLTIIVYTDKEYISEITRSLQPFLGMNVRPLVVCDVSDVTQLVSGLPGD